ncbi:MAG: branched-chain amino acid ABC transporter permease [Armatimonadetes bacterium]|nr:branched-chain amino acid ABC transporter permease [Armatimonadota bacterium]
MEQLGQIPQLIVSGITSGCIYAIVAIGFSIIYSSTQVINFAQGEFVMIGAMVAAVLIAKYSLIVAFPIAIGAACLVGALLAICILIPAKKATVVTLIIITVGASIMLRGLAQLFWGETAIPVAPFTGVRTDAGVEDRVFHIFGAVARAQDLWVIVITAILVVGMHLFFKYTLIGKAMRACSMNPTGARLVGISVRKMIVISFVMAAGLGAIAGVTVSPLFYAKCNMGTALGLKGFCAAVLGGLGSFGGGVAAGIILGIVESLAGGLLWSDYREAVAFVILVAILFIKPQGLLTRGKARA